MSKLLGRGGAIEPTSVEKVTPDERFGHTLNIATMKSCNIVDDTPQKPTECIHKRWTLYVDRRVMICIDCGKRL